MAVFRLLRLLYRFVSLRDLFFDFNHICFRNLLSFMLGVQRSQYLILTLNLLVMLSYLSELLIWRFFVCWRCPIDLIVIWSIRLFIVNTQTSFFFNVWQRVYSYQATLLFVIYYWNSRLDFDFIILKLLSVSSIVKLLGIRLNF
jgi:hypothetical protein